MPHSYTKLVYHLIFSTKHREPLLGPSILARVCAYLGSAVQGEGGVTLIVNGMPDHVHILARLRQDRSLSDVLRAIKAHSSAWIHDTFPALAAFAWQIGYGAFTVSTSQIETVHSYIARQQEHHRKRTFQEEFVAFLDAHGIEYDSQYLWD